MVAIAAFLTLLSGVSALGIPGFSTPPYKCGQVDVFFDGLPPYHPLVSSQGFDPAQVDRALRADAANVIRAGYNLRVVLAGPEKPISTLSDRMKDKVWEATGVGYGVRGSRLPVLTARLEEIITVYRQYAPLAGIVFNYSPNTTLEALQRRYPIAEDCTSKPGKDLGFEIYCDPSVCPQ